MKKLILFLAFSFITSLVLGQNQIKIDSLEIILQQTNITSENKAKIYRELVLLTYRSDEPKTSEYKSQVERLFTETNDTLVLAHLMSISSILCKEDKEGTEQKLFLSKKALSYYQKYNNIDGITSSYNQIGIALKRQNRISEAAEMLLQSIKILEKQPSSNENQIKILLSYMNLYSYLHLAKDTRASKMLNKVISMSEKSSDIKIKAYVFLNASMAYRESLNYDSALYFSKKLYKCAKLMNSDYFYIKAFQQLAQVHGKLLNKTQSINYSQKALDLAIKTKRVNDISLGLLFLGVAYYDIGNYKKAEILLLEAQQSAIEQEKFDMTSQVCNYLTKIYIKARNDEKAILELDNFIKYKDSSDNRRNQIKINELQTKYEIEKKEQQIKDLEQQHTIDELKNQKEVASLQAQVSILGLVLLAPISLLIGGGWYVNRRRLKLKLEAEQKERVKQMSELKALRSQMNPHFIFNALNSIQDFIMLSEKENASDYLGKFATLMRGFLDSSSKEKITLDKELSLLKSYIELEGLRLGEEFSYEINFDGIDEDELDEIEIPPLLIQPYLENAFKHGLLHKTGDKKLLLEFTKVEKQNENFLQLKITDNGVGRQKSAEINARKAKIHHSFATQATNERLELLKNQSTTNKNIEVKINDLKDNQGNGNGTEIVILIPTY